MINVPNTEFVKDSHCSWCGSRFAEQVTWPRKCFVCNNDSYKNPIPIVVSIIPVFRKPTIVVEDIDVLIQKRNIEPKKGEWALPSGYINFGESWEEAAVRENQEEMGIISSPDQYKLLSIKKPTNGNMLVFCYYRGLPTLSIEDVLNNFKANDEVTAVSTYNSTGTGIELAFPTHNECIKEWYEDLKWRIYG